MKFTSLAVAALFLANTSAVSLKGNNLKGVSYDYDEPTLRAAEADNAVKTDYYNAAKKALEIAQGIQAGAADAAAAAGAADSQAGAAKSAAAATFAATDYKSSEFPTNEAANKAAVKAKADDNLVAKTLIMERKQRDFDAASAAKAASDANLKANEERFAYEADQLERGENQDRLKFVNGDTAADTSAILGRHHDRERINGSLLKSLASF